ncbi:hypothetical protein [Aliamphritea spongicola]|uniref:hypothetical protein n=1 Tax=Aliamphritea spongicola TaxID=707589 RepID=UPI00196AF674|nr:hypothetical protein [Aliamphritea spongicola]MBN3561506.1 hypothetical protein [Aliamphritea spongicola]
MKSYLFTTENDRGGVMLCDIEDFDEAIVYLRKRFKGVVSVVAGEENWELPPEERESALPPDAGAPDT